MLLPSLTPADAERFLDAVVEFPNEDGGVPLRFERLQPITDFRRDDSLGEARILYLCQELNSENEDDQPNGHESQPKQFVLKVKVQVPSLQPNGLKTPIAGPSETGKAEIQALQKFTTIPLPSVPHLVARKSEPQNERGLFPGGYVAFTVMTLMPGRNIMDLKFWSLEEREQDEIRQAFLLVLKEVWRAGFAPYDCALRNILWEPTSKECSIVDFEHWEPAKDPINMFDREEMQRWGIVQRPAARTWWHEWGVVAPDAP